MGRKKTGQTPVRRVRVGSIWKEIEKLRLAEESWDEFFQRVKEVMNKNICRTEIISVGQKSESSKVQEIMKILYQINPMLKFGNKTERTAAQRLIDRLGEEKAIGAAQAAVTVHGKKFAPVITTPLELERNLSKLVGFYKQNQTDSKAIRL